jgi:GTPase SAR1 family protein
MTTDPKALQQILDRLEAGKRLNRRELQALAAAAQSQQIMMATGDRSVSIGGNADGAVIVTGDRNIVITGADAEAIRELMGTRPRNERLLLQAVKNEIISRLKQSLHNAILIQLGMEAQPEQVKRLWDSDIKIGSRPVEPIPEGWNILQVFDEVQQKLLILGNPGVGKTTMMLELAKGLCDRAEQQADSPIPVLLNLSTWKDNNQSIWDWLLLELKSKYAVQASDSEELVDDAKLLLMLDGLDELESIRQEPCIQAINELLQSENSLQYVVVCSRQEEYKNYTTKLQLNGAIYLQMLSDAQIQAYLIEIGYQELWQSINDAPDLLEIIRAPLFLNIMVLACQELTSAEWEDLQSENPLQYLWNIYIFQMLIRDVNSNSYIKQNPPSSEQIYTWLTWLALQLEIDFQSEFLIEEIQPTWLPAEIREGKYLLVNYILILLILGLYLILSSSLTDYGVILGLVFWLFTVKILEAKAFEIKEKWSWRSAKVGLVCGLTGSLSDTINSLNSYSYLEEMILNFYDKNIWELLSNPALRALNNHFTFWLMYGLLILGTWNSIGWIRWMLIGSLSFNIATSISLILKTTTVLTNNVLVSILTTNYIVGGLIGGMTGWLIGGILFQSVFRLTENLIEVKFRIIQFKQWSLGNVKNWILIGLVFGLIIGIIFNLTNGLEEFLSEISSTYKSECWVDSNWWCESLIDVTLQKLIDVSISALPFGLIGGLIGGMGVGDFVLPTSNKSILTPNQATWTILKNATTLGISSLAIGTLWNLLSWSSVNLFIDVAFALSTWLWTGGYLCIQHFVIRTILFFEGYVPWHYARFLDYCTDRLLLQRVGGRYRFVHRLLQEHFAEMPLEKE